MDKFDNFHGDESDELILNQFKALFQNSSDALFMMDQDHKVLLANNTFNILFGTAEVRDNELTLHKLLSKRDMYKHVLELIDEHDIAKDLGVTLEGINGQRIVGRLSVVPVCDANDELVGYQGILHDITDRVQAERKLARAEKVVLTGRMVRTIAHEIRNPLTNIALALANLDNPKMDDDERMMLGMIKNNCDRINDLLTELLDSSRPAELELQDVEVRELFGQVAELAHDRLQLQEIRLQEKYPENPVTVQVDLPKMKLALNNIFINAIEAMEHGGTLSVEVKDLEKRIDILISDTGKGIPKDDLAHLFDPFYTTKDGGTGLGLTAVQNILQSHDWGVDVESEAGEGTTFYLTIDRK